MKLFNTLCLEISSHCNRKCPFCPVAYYPRPKEKMMWFLVQKVAEELQYLQYKGRIELYIYNEPMTDCKWLIKIIRLLRSKVPRACLMIATNGDYIKSAKQLSSLFDHGLNQVLINCYSPSSYTKHLKTVSSLPSTVERDGSIYSKISTKKKVVQILDKSKVDEFGKGVFRLTNRAGNIEEFMSALVEPVSRMCVKPFRLLNINWKGDALVCCQDYHGIMTYGNIKNNSLVYLWNHPVMNTYRKHLLSKNRRLPLCETCDCYAGAYAHNVPLNFGATVPIKQLNALQAKNKRYKGTKKPPTL